MPLLEKITVKEINDLQYQEPLNQKVEDNKEDEKIDEEKSSEESKNNDDNVIDSSNSVVNLANIDAIKQGALAAISQFAEQEMMHENNSNNNISKNILSQTRFCSNCGAMIQNENATLCPDCGEPLR